ncbi:unnamed protein product [Rhizophagus irregularis]|uniref:Uncharacterized protein n=1 Tax=Rhizophagus irregularis TaxID=588596 RepID=A0A915ZME3_9GLOM|nr:unnamed protein product [Rhizophagus irregularis]
MRKMWKVRTVSSFGIVIGNRGKWEVGQRVYWFQWASDEWRDQDLFRVSPTNGRTKIRLRWASDGFCKPDNQQKLMFKSGKVSSSIKHGQKSELSIYDEAAGKSTKSQILSHASKRIESRMCGNPLGEGRFGRVYIAREKTRKLLLSSNI